MRLDQLIIAENLATQQEVEEAFEYQRAYGGRLESHLFRLGYMTEDELVEVLSAQFDCSGINLSGVTIREDTLGLLSAELAWRWLALPVSYDSSKAVLTVACEDPRNAELIEALSQACPGATVELKVALGDVLRSCLARSYRQPVRSFEETVLESSEVSSDPSPSAPGLAYEQTESEGSDRCHILVYDATGVSGSAIAQMLSHQNYSVAVVHGIEDLISETRRVFPQAFILAVSGGRDAALELLKKLISRGLLVSGCPAYLVLTSYCSSDASDLLKAGFEDVFGSDNVLDLLMIKLSRLRERLNCERAQRLEIMQTLGTHGSLTDMNVIDLLQAMGQSGKTARISVSAHGQQLTVFLERGRIVYAECDDVRGPEAVYCALGWRQGVWSVDPVAPEELPEPNNNLANEAVLLDGCRRLDEMGHRNSAQSSPTSDPLAVFNGLA
ncbi:MAG: DUF4388 domain-containing protein [candidate division Zixibacteria bacterium]|nr:DUF4388 domain-containing protein [candidate division Zixibacteria bacterium]